MKKDWIKEGYRRWFNYLDEEVPEEAWTTIADELDIDEVWDRVNDELDRSKRPLWSWVARAAAVLALLVSALAAYWYLFPPQNKTETPLAQQTVPMATAPSQKDSLSGRNPGQAAAERKPPASDPAEGLAERSAEAPLERPAEGPPEELAGTAQPDGRSADLPVPRFEEDKGAPPPLREHLANVQAPPSLPLRAIPALPAELDSARLPAPGDAGSPGLKAPEELIAHVPSGNRETAGPAKRRAFISLQRIGVVSAYKNTWMLNHETFNGLQPATLNATSFTYGTSAGINAGFLLDGKHKVSAELYLSSHNGQKYRQYIEARYQSRSIALDYYKLQLYYQLPVFSGKGDVLAGAYGSYLKRGREKIAGEARTVGRFYRDIDYGIMAGYQFNVPVNNRLLLHPGVRVNYGLPNIFKGNLQIPENFLRTHNAAVGLYLGLSYRLY